MNENEKIIRQFCKGVEVASDRFRSFGQAMTGALLGIDPEALVDVPAEDKERMLRFYEQHEAYEHCAVIHKSIQLCPPKN